MVEGQGSLMAAIATESATSEMCRRAEDAKEPAECDNDKTVEQLKDAGNVAFTRAKVLKRTTASKQYLQEAKVCYAEAIAKLGNESANDDHLAMACTLHANLAAVFLLEAPARYAEAKAAADIALTVNPRHVKAHYRFAQACLEDGREGLPEASLRDALSHLDAALEVEPSNSQVREETERIRRRLHAIEDARRIPEPRDVLARVSRGLLDRGGDCLESHGYAWGQTGQAVHVFVPAPSKRLTKSSEVQVEIKPRLLRIALCPGGGEALLHLEGQLHKPVKPDDSSWQLEERGLLLHVELAKQLCSTDKDADAGSSASEHWRCVWSGHPETMAPSAKERKDIEDLAHAAGRKEAEERSAALQKIEEPDPKKEATLKRLRDLCPGINVEWGDTSLDGLRN